MAKTYFEQLHNKRGELRYQVRDILKWHKCETLEQMKKMADACYIFPDDIVRYRIVGRALACYLFPDYAKQTEERENNKANGGSKRGIVCGFYGAGI